MRILHLPEAGRGFLCKDMREHLPGNGCTSKGISTWVVMQWIFCSGKSTAFSKTDLQQQIFLDFGANFVADLPLRILVRIKSSGKKQTSMGQIY